LSDDDVLDLRRRVEKERKKKERKKKERKKKKNYKLHLTILATL